VRVGISGRWRRGIVESIGGVITERRGTGVGMRGGCVVGIVVGVIVEGADVSGGKKLDAATETNTVGGPAGFFERT
jgi:hypothetical protein